VLFGASVPVAKLLLGSGVDSRLMAGLLYLGSGLGLSGTLLIQRLFKIRSAEAPLRRSDALVLSLVIAAGGVIAPLLLTWGSRARTRLPPPCCSIWKVWRRSLLLGLFSTKTQIGEFCLAQPLSLPAQWSSRGAEHSAP
jgi:hypothetical protein